ncbi:unnamed protein product, partial [Mesorhabditis belari]|uniref:Chloride channel protein n=1 Tax=Mesorhabditis belari TaxID=2138241 RepID=A0AAF3EUT3_9BILA
MFARVHKTSQSHKISGLDPIAQVSILSPMAMLQRYHHPPKTSWVQSVMSDIKRSLLDISPGSKGDGDEEEDEDSQAQLNPETFAEFCTRQTRNVLHFLVEDWCLSACLGIITAVLSVGMDVAIEEIQHLHVVAHDWTIKYLPSMALSTWVIHVVFFTAMATLFCKIVSEKAVGSGIPEVKVIMHGFKMDGYLTLRTLIAKMVGLTLAMGGGLPIGKEGPFVHIGAIVATLLSKITASCQYSAFFSNEGREMEMLSTGCAVGIACTFSAPIGAVLYAIESTSKYFAVKNYWRSFLAATCSAIVFRFANFFVTAEQSGTITAFYQTRFPTESFMIEELPVFALLGLFLGILAALFTFTHRRIFLFRQKNRLYRLIFKNNFFSFTLFFAFIVGVVTYPKGFGKYIAGRLTFRETMADFFNNCTWGANDSRACSNTLLNHWMGGEERDVPIFLSLACYIAVYFVLVAICISINVPAGVFVPSFIIGAACGRLTGETMMLLFPQGLRGPGGPPIYPGLYAVVGAAAYTGAVTHTLSVAVIVCELTGQLTPILPVLIAMLMGNAICKFLQPSIYESIIRVKKYPYLPELPPSRFSVHTVKVEQIMVEDVIYITKDMTYRELKEILTSAPHLRSFPIVTDHTNKLLLGSVAKRYLVMLLRRHVLISQQDSRTSRLSPADIINTIRRTSMRLSKRGTARRQEQEQRIAERGISRVASNRSAEKPKIKANKSAPMLSVTKEEEQFDMVNDRTFSGNTYLSISPLHAPNNVPLHAVFTRPSSSELHKDQSEEELLGRTIDLDEIAIDSAPFQLVLASSLYKVHTLFSLLGLSHAYVTDKGRLIGVVGLKELRDALAHIYVRGVLPAKPDRKLTSGVIGVIQRHQSDEENKDDEEEDGYKSENGDVSNGNGITIRANPTQNFGNTLTVPSNV